MGENLKDKFSALGEKLKVGGAGVSRKMSERMNSVGGKMREMFQVSNQADKLVVEATAENLDGPDWGKNLEICDLVEHERLNGQDVVRSIKKRLLSKSTVAQFLALCLLESCVKNCEKMFSEVASEKVLDEMVKMVDDPLTVPANREKALKLIEAWGEATEELRYLPIYEETYKSLKSRGVSFPGRDAESLAPIFTPPQSVASIPVHATPFPGGIAGQDVDLTPASTKEVFDVARNSVELLSTVLSSSPQQEALQEELTTALVEQCRQSQLKVQQIIQRAGENEALLFEALNVNDELQHVLSKYEESFVGLSPQAIRSAEPALVNAQVINYEEESALVGPEDALVRSRPSKPSSAQSLHHSDGLADLDEMIFGKKGGNAGEEGSRAIGKKKDSDDLILF
ncbi:hypothetical protein O6H91_01G070200 [Diphasiastrum complanatum]|uniref:Uncharacterized protein n=1 Tax=Diphasiastrum complanatum TaxID=34168 RepID=A0ACC2ESE7_DIPCM|nr:hypothetical protein O6H91_Y533800 [Diphasiastrum complanatum]KAJ7569285.1 hypothetical protein O6H91_01G070200 [Diphasiastrum complanatum]